MGSVVSNAIQDTNYSMSEVATSLRSLTGRFLDHHVRSNDLYWETKKGLAADRDESRARLAAADLAFQQFTEDPEWLRTLSDLESQAGSAEELSLVRSWARLFQC